MPARTKKNHRTQKNPQGSFRIIGGEWRSRRLSFPIAEGLRPTTDRVRETLFNWLASYLPGARVLDLFAGSGSLGLEALSRGASGLVAVERDKLVVQAIKTNLHTLKSEHETDIVNADAIGWLQSADLNDVNILFLDPPFRTALLDQVLQILSQQAKLKSGTMVYLEVEKEKQDLFIPPNWSLEREKQAGQVSYRLYAVIGDKE